LTSNDLLVIGATEIATALMGREQCVLDTVRQAYETHARGDSSLPHSSFLRFPDSDSDRIICLPAYLGGDYELAGVKWIASVPANVAKGIERASAVMVLNERDTGRPFAVIEGSIISKQRTAASAALASRILAAGKPDVIGFVGCGPINLEVARFLAVVWPQTARIMTFDLEPSRAAAFGRAFHDLHPNVECSVAPTLEALLSECQITSFGTTAIRPYVQDLESCPPAATILHVSLRDLSVRSILSNHNIVDDLDHVNRAATSIHLASQQEGHTRFVHSSLGDLLTGTRQLPERDGRKMVFSPFGLGILDLAVANIALGQLAAGGFGTRVRSFLP
jgi:ornithine cyclodeaminase